MSYIHVSSSTMKYGVSAVTAVYVCLELTTIWSLDTTVKKVPVIQTKKTHIQPDVAHQEVVSEPESGLRIRLGNYGDNSRDNSRDIGRDLLEVYRGGRWGIVCDDNWDLNSAHVACRELGFTHGARYVQDSGGESFGHWSDDSFVLDDVTCHGNESSLLECGYTSHHDCHVFEAVSIVCQPNPGCADSWVAGPTGCYMIQTHTRGLLVSTGEEMCANFGGYLANINSILENDFLSTSLRTLYPDKPEWIIGGKYIAKDDEWVWEKLTREKKDSHKKDKDKQKHKKKKRERKKAQKEKKRKEKEEENEEQREEGDSRRENLRREMEPQIRHRRDKRGRDRWEEYAMDITVWFPGWLPSHVKREPSANKGLDCLALSRIYSLPNGSDSEVSYFFWKSVPCYNTDGHMSYICERPLEYDPDGNILECYHGAGRGYRGMTHVTVDGVPCQNWTLSLTTNPKTHPHQGLGSHNWCRNPDSDDRPWCWTNVTTDYFSYCAIPLCYHTDEQVRRRPDVAECPNGQYHCHSNTQGICIDSMFRCDGEGDCPAGEDEQQCDYILPTYNKNEDVLTTTFIQKTFGAIPVELCAKFCFEEKDFDCKLFSYRKPWKYCYLSGNGGLGTTYLEDNADYDTYFLNVTDTRL